MGDRRSSSTMAGTFFKALNWVANEFLVEKLANNRAFQRVALRMHEKETKMAETVKSEMGNQKASEYLWSKAENLGKQASEAMAEGQTKAPEGAYIVPRPQPSTSPR